MSFNTDAEEEKAPISMCKETRSKRVLAEGKHTIENGKA
jgi:hypothetical protein